MAEQQEIEMLLSRIINLFADEFGKQAILRGGMVLRLLDSPRFTNDLDYIFIPYKSKNDITKPILKALNSLEDVTVTHSLNSKCLRCVIKKGSITVQVEAKVDQHCKVAVVSTASLSKLYNQTPRIINVMAYDVALANKLAAWYERRLIRDLFDVYLFLSMGIAPDKAILEKRLRKPIFSKRVKTGKDFTDMSSFFIFLKQEVEKLSNQDIIDEIGAIFPKDELPGLNLKIKKAIMTKL
jgi:predicted nucleotidyltransferase component of viral defense system